MGRRIVCLVCVLLLMLSVCACEKNAIENPTGSISPDISVPSDGEIRNFGDLMNLFTKETSYRSWSYTVYGAHSCETIQYELYTKGHQTYYSLIDPNDNADFVIRYTTEEPKNSTEVFHENAWIPCAMGPNSFSLDDDISGLAALSKETPANDATIEIDGKTYTSKRIVVYDSYFFDYIKEGDDHMVALTITRQGDTYIIVFSDIILSDSIPATSRIAPTLNAEPNTNLIGYYMASDSMSPAIPFGSMCYFTIADPQKIQVGDVVLAFMEEISMFVAHRVVEIQNDGTGFILQGDCNLLPDSTVFKPADIRGVLSAAS